MSDIESAFEALKLNVPFQREASLAHHLYVGLGGPAFLVVPMNSTSLIDVCAAMYRERMPMRLLGGGANLLVADEGPDEVVVSTNGAKGVFKIGESGEKLRVDAGVSLPWLISKCREDRMSGLEGLVGIPGSIGGVVAMNAGGKFGSIGDIVREVVILRPDGELEAIKTDASHFQYRRSQLGEGVILEAVLQLERKPKDAIFAKMKEALEYKRATQPLSLKTTGCFFKNPEGHHASRLIDEAGLKGERRGNASISTLHANFFVNEGGALASDFLALAVHARDRVFEKFQVELTPEVEIWGDSWPALSS